MESEGSVILIDPNLRESFREETFRFCPDRIVHLERLPPPDVILLSHRHRDHFDLASLTHFDRKTPIIYPQDPLMTYGLKQLGFVELMPTGDWNSTYGVMFRSLQPSRALRMLRAITRNMDF